MPLALVAVPVDLRRLVEAGGRKLDARHVGLPHQLCEVDLLVADAHPVGQELDLLARHLVFIGGEVGEPVADGARGGLGRHAVEVCPGRGRGRRGVGHLACGRGGDLHPVEVDLEFLGHHLRDLDVEPLPHLGAAVIEMHRAVRIDMHQRPGLVEVRRRERDAELYRRQRQAALDDAAVGVEGVDLAAPLRIVGALLELGDDALDDIVLHRLVIGCHVAFRVAVEIALADLERVPAGGEGHLLDDALRTDHALRSAEAAKGRVGDGVCIERRGNRPDRRPEIGIVAVEQRPVGDRAGEIRREAAARSIDVVDAQNVAVVVEADLIVDHEIVPLAGRGHVVVAIGTDLDGAVELLGGDGRECRELVALGFLAAEAAAHAAGLDRDGVARHAENVADHVLHLARVLRRGIDGDVMVFAGNGEGDLAFEIEVVLAAEPHAALQPARRLGDGSGGIAALQRQRRCHQFRRCRIEMGDVDDCRLLPVLHPREAAGTPRLLARLRDDAEDRLAEELDGIRRQHRFVVTAGRRNVVDPRHVVSGQHVDDARSRPHRRQVHLPDGAVRHRRQAEAAMQRTGRLRHVVDIDRLPGDMLVRGIVALIGGDAAADLAGLEVGGCVLVHGHALTPRRFWRPAPAPWCRWSRRRSA